MSHCSKNETPCDDCEVEEHRLLILVCVAAQNLLDAFPREVDARRLDLRAALDALPPGARLDVASVLSARAVEALRRAAVVTGEDMRKEFTV